MKQNLFTGFLVLWLALLTFAILKEKPPAIVTVPAPTPVSSQSGPAVGRYEVVKLAPNVWRFDTTSGDLCLLLASASETKRLGEVVVLCPSTPEETERLRRVLIIGQFNKLPKEQRTPEMYQKMLRENR